MVEDSLDNKEQPEKSTMSTEIQFDIDLIIKKVPGNNKRVVCSKNKKTLKKSKQAETVSSQSLSIRDEQSVGKSSESSINSCRAVR